ncbi:actin like protein ALP1 [Babesia caballi]|uniref:Actin like protein ALP1 n=1 Tax=Babesia caballi TaxID=5871 RepID=A0AAV4LTF1_BABCB|nr:actin like protein ALP1 [Babesia caballi]
MDGISSVGIQSLVSLSFAARLQWTLVNRLYDTHGISLGLLVIETLVKMSILPSVIFDTGSLYLKAGLSDQKEPQLHVPSVYGEVRKRFQGELPNVRVYGDDCMKQMNYMSVTHVVDHGHIFDFEAAAGLWKYGFDMLGMVSEGNSVLVTEPVLCSPEHHQKVGEIFLEGLGVDEIHMSITGLLSMYGIGKNSGTVVDIGDGMVQVVPMEEGHLQKSAIRRVDAGGMELTMYLQRLLCEMGYPMTSREDFAICRKIKEELCFCSLDPRADESNATALEKEYVLPDGQTLRDGETNAVNVSVERFYVCEAIFNPRILGSDRPGLAKVVWDSIQNSGITQRKLLMENIYLCGAGSQFENLHERLKFELQNLAPPAARANISVHTSREQHMLSWKGACFMGSPEIRNAYKEQWITKADYDEDGARVFLRQIIK